MIRFFFLGRRVGPCGVCTVHPRGFCCSSDIVRCVCALRHHPWSSYSVFVRLISLGLVSHYQRLVPVSSFRLRPTPLFLSCGLQYFASSANIHRFGAVVGLLVIIRWFVLICSWKLFAIAKARCRLLMSGASRCFGPIGPGDRSIPVRVVWNVRRRRWLQHQGLSGPSHRQGAG